MTQVGEGIAVTLIAKVDDPEECIFCHKKHQDAKPEPPHNYAGDKNTKKLKEGGQKYAKTVEGDGLYPDPDRPPLTNWEKIIHKTGGYKAAAHHCLAVKILNKHEISGELKKAGYDCDRGSNCIMLPYSKQQFSRARAYNKIGQGQALQKHRGGHTNAYYDTVKKHMKDLAQQVARKFCPTHKVDAEWLLGLMKVEERRIFNGIVSIASSAYKLYNDSFMAPRADWGTYDWEKGKEPTEYLKLEENLAEEVAAESESAEDPDT